MISTWLLHCIDWNPQLWREVRSRFAKRRIAVLAGLTILGQLLLLQYFRRELLQPLGTLNYCKISAGTEPNYACTFANLNDPLIDWQVWWFDIFHALTWIALLVLLLGGSYLIVKDIAQEERLGTLTLVRLSPQSAQSVLLGKLLGVPSLLYFAIALIVPLHFWAALQAGFSIIRIFSIYIAIVILCSFAYVFALLYGLGWGAMAYVWYVVLPGIFIVYLPLLVTWVWWGVQHRKEIRFPETPNETAFSTNEFLLVVLFGLITLGTYSLWQLCLPRFHVPPLSESSLAKPR